LTQPESPSSSAFSLVLALKKTPCTNPLTTKRSCRAIETKSPFPVYPFVFPFGKPLL
jgi:hypothetical protein